MTRRPLLSRRTFLAGSAGAAGLLVLAACGGGGNGSSAQGTSGNGSGSTGAGSGSDEPNQGPYTLVQFFGPGLFAVGQPARLPFGLGNSLGVITAGGPAEMTFVVRDLKNQVVAGPTPVARHDEGLARPYWPLVVTLPEKGQYIAQAVIDGEPLSEGAFFQVDDPADVTPPQPGEALPALVTPTTTDAAGVDPICTRSPACPYHDLSYADALAAGKPIALLIATPAYCKTAICGPVLDVLTKEVEPFKDQITVIHNEVYTDDTLATTTPAVQALNLDYEPVLFLLRPDGTVRERLDVIWDQAEVRDALTRLVG